MELRQIDKNIRAVKNMGAKMNDLIHTTALAIVSHAQDHGDCTRALSLVQAMPASLRREKLIRWFATYSPIGMNLKGNDGKGKVGLHKPDSKTYKPFNIDGARANPFYAEVQADADAEPDTLTVESAVNSLKRIIKRFEKKIEDGQVAQNDREEMGVIVDRLKALAA